MAQQLKSNKDFSTGMGLPRPEIPDDDNLPADDPMRGWLRRMRQFFNVVNGVVQITAPGPKTIKGDLFFPAWTEVATFAHSWDNYGAPFPKAAYCIDAFNIVRVIGALKSGTLGQAAFTMGAAYAPSGVPSGRVLPIGTESQSGGSFIGGRVDIDTSGQLIPTDGNNGIVIITLSYRAVGP